MDHLNIFNLNNALEPTTTMAMAYPMGFGDRGGGQLLGDAWKVPTMAMTATGCLMVGALDRDTSGGHGVNLPSPTKGHYKSQDTTMENCVDTYNDVFLENPFPVTFSFGGTETRRTGLMKPVLYGTLSEPKSTTTDVLEVEMSEDGVLKFKAYGFVGEFKVPTEGEHEFVTHMLHALNPLALSTKKGRERFEYTVYAYDSSTAIETEGLGSLALYAAAACAPLPDGVEEVLTGRGELCHFTPFNAEEDSERESEGDKPPSEKGQLSKEGATGGDEEGTPKVLSSSPTVITLSKALPSEDLICEMSDRGKKNVHGAVVTYNGVYMEGVFTVNIEKDVPSVMTCVMEGKISDTKWTAVACSDLKRLEMRDGILTWAGDGIQTWAGPPGTVTGPPGTVTGPPGTVTGPPKTFETIFNVKAASRDAPGDRTYTIQGLAPIIVSTRNKDGNLTYTVSTQRHFGDAKSTHTYVTPSGEGEGIGGDAIEGGGGGGDAIFANKEDLRFEEVIPEKSALPLPARE